MYLCFLPIFSFLRPSVLDLWSGTGQTDRQTTAIDTQLKDLNFLYNLKSFKECTTYDSKAVVGRYAISDDSVRLVLLHATIHSRLRRCRPIWRTMSPHSPTINEVTSDSQDVIAGFCSRRSSYVRPVGAPSHSRLRSSGQRGQQQQQRRRFVAE